MLPRSPVPLFLAAAVLAAPTALAAGTIKCKIEESRIAFTIARQGDTADIAVGTLSSTPKPAFKGVPVASEGDALIVTADPSHAIASGKAGCAEYRNRFHLRLAPAAGGGWRGELEISPHFTRAGSAPQGCKGFPAPEIVEDTHKNVICLTSN